MRRIATPWLNFQLFSGFKLLRQTETSECGLACIAMVAHHHGMRTDISTMRGSYEVSARGSTARDLAITAERLGLSTRTVRCELEDLERLRLPAILHWNLGHFVVLHKVRGRRLFIADPSAGLMTMDLVEASPHFTGIAIELAPTPHFERRNERTTMSLRKLIRVSPPLVGAFAQALVLSLLVQITLLLVPLYMQMVIDEGVQRGDGDILTLLLTGILAVAVFSAVATYLRSLTIQFMTQVIAFDMNSAVFQHLVRLPLTYFQKRQIGDIQQRFRSLMPIQQALGTGAVTGIIDGALSIATLILMCLYSMTLTVIALGFVALNVALRFVSLSASRNAASALMNAEGREQSRFLETLRTMATIKVNAAEEARSDLWRSNAAATINAQVERGNITQASASLTQFVSAVSDALIIYVAATLALAGEITIGVMTAFLAYKLLFSSKIAALIDQVIVFSLLDVQLERVGDIVLSPREAKIDEIDSRADEMRGEIELSNVSFRYSNFDPFVLDSVNLHIAAGEFVAITGPSGGGKSTLLRLLVGLNQPTSGIVRIDGRPLSDWGPRPVRQQVSFVMQDDQLFAATILDNVTLFERDPDMDRVAWSIRAAAIDREIADLPMGLGSLVGDLGALLSGGQKQRLLIARALYRKPKILIMDEGTSHLDAEREAIINAALRDVPITRVVVAHRRDTIAAADKVFVLNNRSLRAAA